jgi:hypothetical protein
MTTIARAARQIVLDDDESSGDSIDALIDGVIHAAEQQHAGNCCA